MFCENMCVLAKISNYELHLAFCHSVSTRKENILFRSWLMFAFFIQYNVGLFSFLEVDSLQNVLLLHGTESGASGMVKWLPKLLRNHCSATSCR